MIEHKETCLKINGKQTIKLKSGSIKFKNCFKELAADWESLLKGVRVTEKHQEHIPCSFAYKVVSIDDKLSKPVPFVLYRGKTKSIDLLKQILKSVIIAKKQQHFNKNLI